MEGYNYEVLIELSNGKTMGIPMRNLDDDVMPIALMMEVVSASYSERPLDAQKVIHFHGLDKGDDLTECVLSDAQKVTYSKSMEKYIRILDEEIRKNYFENARDERK